MSKVKVILDSTAYIPEEIIKDLPIEIIPLHVIWDDEIFRDGVDITPDEFYERLSKSKTMPTTSQPSPEEFSKIFQKYLSQGDDILCVHISSKFSGTVDSAQQAKEALSAENIEIVDSLFTTLGLGIQALAAARAAKAGASLAECKRIAETMRSNTDIYFIVSTLEFLKRGGRIGGAAAFMGSALNLKPILKVQEGEIAAHDKIRTMKKAIVKIVDILEEHVGDKKFYVGVSEATAKENAAVLKKEITSRFPAGRIVEYIESGLSPVIGIHAGPGTLSLAFTTIDD